MNDVERHEKIFPFGAQVSSKSRRRFCRGKPNGPEWIVRGDGALVWDQSGRQYIDLTAGLGTLTLGHRVDNRTCRSYPLPNRSELVLGEMIQDMIPWAWRMRFLKNGGDATNAAVRLSRVYTGRDLIIDFGSYHGCQDPWINDCHEGVPKAIRDLTIRCEPTIENIERINDIAACVILEAMPLNPLPDGFLALLRRKCSREGAVLIFDDIISGFRAHPQGAAGLTGIIPDLTCAGKALGNGWPISVVYGQADIMDCWERTHLSATHWAEPASMDAAVASLTAMKAERFWERQAKWAFGGVPNNGHWAVMKLSDVDQTFIQTQLLQEGIISNLSQFFYIDLEEHREKIGEIFTRAVGNYELAISNGVNLAGTLDCQVNQSLFKRNS